MKDEKGKQILFGNAKTPESGKGALLHFKKLEFHFHPSSFRLHPFYHRFRDEVST